MGSENGSFIDSTDVPTSVPTGIPSSVPSSVPTSTPTSLPTLEATGEPSGGLFVVYDSFDGFNSGLWSSQCSGCTYGVDADGKSVLYVRGSDQLMVSKSTYSGVLSIQGGFWKDNYCSDQFVMLSPYSDRQWYWSSDSNAIKFVWNCNWKVIYSPTGYRDNGCASQ